MNRNKILTLPAGALMDGLLAEAYLNYPACIGGAASIKGAERRFVVMGTEPIWLAEKAEIPKTCARYSTDATACLSVVAALNKTHLLETSQYWAQGGYKGGKLGFRAVFRGFTESVEEANRATGSTFMEAVGRAALLCFVQQPFQAGERVLYNCPHDDFPSGPVTITQIPAQVSPYDLVQVTSADGQVYAEAAYADLKALPVFAL